ncbi:IcmL-like protein [Legionella sainthelensi]|uniref:IcmL-like protein n=1 Tax=Legionella sainthelensi TaxID=28087 RepID=A0A0W0YH02_9GAMM|nr:DotI/IcmL family type IV secretion protein [Legionella sainthelensi]KTD55935.1 IcmL-like protein [Legionella sainthelensi]VEH29149.1 IcmL-like protein [Legionella sainthelensi]
MKNTILWGALITLIGAQVQVHADVAQPASPSTPAPNTLASPQAQTPPVQSLPSVSSAQPVPPPVINCDYKIPPETKKIDQSLVITWSEKAVTQAFDFDPNKLDEQLQKLEACFTEQGWTGFNTALQKSGNLEAIKSQKLTVSSQVMGQAIVTEAKENQWKLNLPLQVVYQNDKEKVTQLLSIDVTIGRKITGDLGIIQMIAAPRNTEKSSNPNTPSTTPSSNSGTTPAPTTPAPTTPATTTSPTTNPASTSTGQPNLPTNSQ